MSSSTRLESALAPGPEDQALYVAAPRGRWTGPGTVRPPEEATTLNTLMPDPESAARVVLGALGNAAIAQRIAWATNFSPDPSPEQRWRAGPLQRMEEHLEAGGRYDDPGAPPAIGDALTLVLHASMLPAPERSLVERAWEGRALRSPLTENTLLRLQIDFSPARPSEKAERIIETLRRSRAAMREAEHFERTQAALRQRGHRTQEPRQAQRLANEAQRRADTATRGIERLRDTQGIWVGGPQGTPRYLAPREHGQPAPSAPRREHDTEPER